MTETLMTSDRERTSHLNSLPDSHWKEWHATEDAINDRTDELVAGGMHWEPALDQAISETLG